MLDPLTIKAEAIPHEELPETSTIVSRVDVAFGGNCSVGDTDAILAETRRRVWNHIYGDIGVKVEQLRKLVMPSLSSNRDVISFEFQELLEALQGPFG